MRGFQEYRNAQVNTASTEELVPLLFQEAVRREDRAMDALQAGDVRTFREHLTRVRDIFTELLLSLDPETAPEVVANLKRLYFWGVREANKASQTKDPEVLAGLRKVTISLLETWTEAVEAAR